MRDVALITGASSGIGADLARVFARNGHDLALVARRVEALETLATELTRQGRSRPLVVAGDLGDRDAPDAIASTLVAAGARVACLVNNAGFGLCGPVARLDGGEQCAMVDINARAVLALTTKFLPDLCASGGRILNVASVASVMPGPGMAVYYATKAFVSAFSRALGEELKGEVTVSVLHPGITATGFQARAGYAARSGKGASAMVVAEAAYSGLMAGRRTIVPGFGNKAATLIAPLVPDAVLLPIVHRFQRARYD